MGKIKRVLWVDDNPGITAEKLFDLVETKNVSTMDEAIEEISGEHLYDYDTIVLDIDFSNGLPNGEKKIVEVLSEKIYLSDEQKEKEFIIRNGGYLLYLYLLEKGYPSDKIAFLTGNSGMIDALRRYTAQNRPNLTKEEIIDAFFQSYRKSDGDPDTFEDLVDRLVVDSNYTDSDLILDCFELLEKEDYEECRNRLINVIPSATKESVLNTGDEMIYRFHKANLESPAYFSKIDNQIPGHDFSDAQQWMESRRRENDVTRWLVLDVSAYIESLYKDHLDRMNEQIGRLFFSSIEEQVDPGIRSGFQQMFMVFDGLKNINQRGIYYQAVSAMLIPFGIDKRRRFADKAEYSDTRYDDTRKMFAHFSRQARNYCAHNYFGLTLSNPSTLFILMGAVSAVLSRDQQEYFCEWYRKVCQVFGIEGQSYNAEKNNEKIDNLCIELITRDVIDIERAGVIGKDYSDYKTRDVISALGYNKRMRVELEPDTTVREAYYIFTLAAYVVKWFEGVSDIDIAARFGKGIKVLFEVSHSIVSKYEYPYMIDK